MKLLAKTLSTQFQFFVVHINKYVLLLLVMLVGGFHCMDVNAKKKKKEPIEYDIRCGGSGSQGYYLVEVSAYTDDSSQIGSSLVCRCAIHGVLFKGFTGTQGCTAQRPLAGNAYVEQQHPDFFTTFFQDGGGYATYASIVEGTIKTVKEEKRYKVTALVSVAKEQLRQDLEKTGIIKGLGSGF